MLQAVTYYVPILVALLLTFNANIKQMQTVYALYVRQLSNHWPAMVFFKV